MLRKKYSHNKIKRWSFSKVWSKSPTKWSINNKHQNNILRWEWRTMLGTNQLHRLNSTKANENISYLLYKKNFIFVSLSNFTKQIEKMCKNLLNRFWSSPIVLIRCTCILRMIQRFLFSLLSPSMSRSSTSNWAIWRSARILILCSESKKENWLEDLSFNESATSIKLSQLKWPIAKCLGFVLIESYLFLIVLFSVLLRRNSHFLLNMFGLSELIICQRCWML